MSDRNLEMATLTRGQKIMDVPFNATGRADITELKTAFANLYDLIEKHFDASTELLLEARNAEVLACNGLDVIVNERMNFQLQCMYRAKEYIETAAMYAVKMVTR